MVASDQELSTVKYITNIYVYMYSQDIISKLI